MEVTKLAELKAKLAEAQVRKSVGTIAPGHLERFVLLVEGVSDKVRSAFSIPAEKLAIYATLSPRTSLGDYDGRNTHVVYRGPYTAVILTGGEYQVERVESVTEWVIAARNHEAGVSVKLEISTSQPLLLDALMNLASGSDPQESGVSTKEGKLVVTLHFPYAAVSA